MEEVQREVWAQNEGLLAAHLKGEHSINRCLGARQNWSGLALKLILYFSNNREHRSSRRSCWPTGCITSRGPLLPQAFCENALVSGTLVDAESLGIGLDYPACLAFGIYKLAARWTLPTVRRHSQLTCLFQEEIIMLSKKYKYMGYCSLMFWFMQLQLHTGTS